MMRGMFHRSSCERLAQLEGVERPFRILVRMPQDARMRVAQLLGCWVHEADAPDRQAWRIINQSLRGLQARTHHLGEQLTPFSRNNDWRRILERAARRCGLELDAGLDAQVLERRLFEHLADAWVRQHLLHDDPEQLLNQLHPNLDRAIRSLGLSRNGRSAIVVGLLHAMDHARKDPREGMNRLTDFLRLAMPWTWTTSISTGCRILSQRAWEICEAWLVHGLGPWARTNYGRVCAVLVALHLYSVLEETGEQFDLAGR